MSDNYEVDITVKVTIKQLIFCPFLTTDPHSLMSKFHSLYNHNSSELQKLKTTAIKFSLAMIDG